MNEQVWWYVARASGLVSWGLLTASVLWGVVLSTRLVGKSARPAWLLDLHRFLGGLACAFTGFHVAGLVADSWIDIGWAETLVPMASSWRPGPVAWGVVSLYVLAAVEVTSLLGRRIPKPVWRRVHALSFLLWVTATVHTLSAGTDAAHPVVLFLTYLSVLAVLFTGVVRVLSPKPDARSANAEADATRELPDVGVPAGDLVDEPQPQRLRRVDGAAGGDEVADRLARLAARRGKPVAEAVERGPVVGGEGGEGVGVALEGG